MASVARNTTSTTVDSYKTAKRAMSACRSTSPPPQAPTDSFPWAQKGKKSEEFAPADDSKVRIELLNVKKNKCGSKFFTLHSSLFTLFCIFAHAKRKKSACRDGGMVDTRDLKSLGHNGCAGSSPARGTQTIAQHSHRGCCNYTGGITSLNNENNHTI